MIAFSPIIQNYINIILKKEEERIKIILISKIKKSVHDCNGALHNGQELLI